MAVLLLNTLDVPDEFRLGDTDRRVAYSGVSHLTWNPVILSAQYDDLSILTPTPDHLVQCVADSPGDSTHGVPGLRAEAVENDGEALVLRHVPTGALLRFRYFEYYNHRRRKPSWFFDTHFAAMRRDCAIGPRERAVLDAVPPIHADAEYLLAGVTARLTCWHKQEGWAVSRLVHDDIAHRGRDKDYWPFLHLWGEGTEWVLRWGGLGSVPPADVAHALTHEIVGLKGARAVVKGANQSEVRFGKARLVLERPRTEYSDLFGRWSRAR
ncbi:hypothetical protein BC739_004024 [Kutzneria viridogrisea]|uniref:Uncharacterized protein n=1 Tax=Kutzneria viridogrisea TaxID=47990 RepID=A0ABR6BIV4_9PSEU|nr:hypothetical protein [Kutzneria viridogrisea]